MHLAPDDATRHREHVEGIFRPLSDRHLVSVHQPFALEDGRLPDLASPDADHREATMEQLHAVGEVAARIRASLVVVHPGGVRRRGEPDGDPDVLAESLERLELPVPVVLENMPRWYHLPDGTTLRSTLCRTPEELLVFDELVAGFCLDTSHAWGARDPGSVDHVRGFLDVADRILHVHAADSAPPDREGLPFSEGELTRDLLRDVAHALNPRVACIPEIKGGHEARHLFAEALAWLDDAGCFAAARAPASYRTSDNAPDAER